MFTLRRDSFPASLTPGVSADSCDCSISIARALGLSKSHRSCFQKPAFILTLGYGPQGLTTIPLFLFTTEQSESGRHSAWLWAPFCPPSLTHGLVSHPPRPAPTSHPPHGFEV